MSTHVWKLKAELDGSTLIRSTLTDYLCTLLSVSLFRQLFILSAVYLYKEAIRVSLSNLCYCVHCYQHRIVVVSLN